MFAYLKLFGVDDGLIARFFSHSWVQRWSKATGSLLFRGLSLLPGFDAGTAHSSQDMTTTEDTSASTATGGSSGVLQHGCKHYKRRCKLVAPCCDRVVWCRHCHNLETNENEQDPTKRHILDRKAVKEVVCALCDTRQPVAANCINCDTEFGAYSCLKCNFFDDDTTRQQFHCEDCGICRVGGRENYFHCSTCNCCYNKAILQDHVCVENSMHQNCAVCYEYLFDSVKAISVMPCGHTIHRDCLQQLYDHRTYTCPICCRTTVDLRPTWHDLDETITSTPMPAEYRDVKVTILCNDCGERSLVPFHILGHRCNSCSSYNTRRV